MDGIVTVVIITYNHKDYIGRALDSVLCQETQYPYDIVVHDDASTDGTTEILLDYADRFPGRLNLIIEDVNTYSKGRTFRYECIVPYVKGKYVINLDGDDYWCDKRKIQKQIDYMESHPEVVATTHRCEAVRLNPDGVLRHVGYSPKEKKMMNGQ